MKKIAIISNVNLDMLIRDMKKSYDVFDTEGYGEWVSYALGANKRLLDFAPDFIFVIIDGNALLEQIDSIEKGNEEIDRALTYIDSMNDIYYDCSIVISDIDILPLRIADSDAYSQEDAWKHRWKERLEKVVNANSRMHIMKLSDIIYASGRDSMYSPQLWYMGSIPYSIEAISTFKGWISDYIQDIDKARKKVLVIDLDNTIWGGVVGEDGTNGICLGNSGEGACYRDAQKRIKEIKNTGVLLAIVSKNNYDDVDDVFSNNNHMILGWSDFAAYRINWNSKSENIIDLSKELNVTTSDFVFLDDNPIERAEVRQNTPDICIADFPKDKAKLPEAVSSIYNDYFRIFKMTDEDHKKTEFYQQEKARKSERNVAASLDDYLNSLGIIITISEVSDNSIERTIQLINKTNQFNTNTIRMNVQQLHEYESENGHHILTVDVKDKYGDNGMVAVMMLRVDCTKVVIDNFLMSCRVMGRRIENAIITALLSRLRENKVITVTSSYEPTVKNKPVEDFWERMGFRLIKKDDDNNMVKHYIFDIEYYSKKEIYNVKWRS